MSHLIRKALYNAAVSHCYLSIIVKHFSSMTAMKGEHPYRIILNQIYKGITPSAQERHQRGCRGPSAGR